jgi:fermentation-respiration switch protein FrsA (DUF1100 family)
MNLIESRAAYSGISFSDRNPQGIGKKGFLLLISIRSRKILYLLFISSVWCFSGCLSQVLYHPSRELRGTPSDLGLSYEWVALETADGARLSAWWVPADSPRGALLFCHGNAGNISDRLDSIRIFNRLGLSLFFFDYRGYGKSIGSPSEQGTYRDAEAAWNYLIQARKTDPQKIVVFGRSLGGSIAAWVSQANKPRALILESTFISLREAARDHLPGPLAKLFVPDQYHTLQYLKRVHCPVLILHSRKDESIPFRHGEALYATASEPKEFVEIHGSHNRGFLDSQPLYEAALDLFLSKYLGRRGEGI